MLKLTQTVLNNLKSSNSKFFVLKYDKHLKSTTIAEAKSNAGNSFDNEIETQESPKTVKYTKSPNNMVAAAFAALKPNNTVMEKLEISTPITDEKISRATNVNELLSISEGNGISRKHALKVVSTLAEWSSSGKTKVSDFENDTRFIKLCRILSKGARINRNMLSRSEDLSTILMVTADDEAARLISGLTLSQMVKVMTTLTIKKRRSVLLLRTLAYNITASNDQLDLKQSADLLYSMCQLNFIDENLLAKICGDVINESKNNIEKSTVIGSIVTSIGLLKYKNCEIMDVLSEWVLNNRKKCRPQEVFSLFITLATIHYSPSNSEELFRVLIPQMSIAEARKPTVWLNFIWSLIILEQASSEHISSAFIPEFLNKLEGDTSSSPMNISSRMKLLNIIGAAKNLNNYPSDLLPNVQNVDIIKTKEKTKFTESVIDSLKNLIHSENHLRLDVNTGLGFCIDAECLLDRKCNPLPFNPENEKKIDTIKVAVLVYDYHDMCIGKIDPSGVNILAQKILQAQNYKILTIPYSEFRAADKLVQRVQYLENKLKNIVK